MIENIIILEHALYFRHPTNVPFANGLVECPSWMNTFLSSKSLGLCPLIYVLIEGECPFEHEGHVGHLTGV